MKPRQLRWDVLCMVMCASHFATVSQLAAADADTAKAPLTSINALSTLQLPAAARRVIERPTLTAAGPIESFRGSPALYQWMLEHPDQAMKAWLRLGAKGREISDRGAAVSLGAMAQERQWFGRRFTAIQQNAFGTPRA